MKVRITCFLILVSCVQLLAQLDNTQSVISLEGNYMKNRFENGVSTNQINTLGHYLNVSPSIGFNISKRTIVTFGIDYNRSSEVKESSLMLGDKINIESMELKSTSCIPFVSIGNQYKIINKLYLAAYLKMNIGMINTNSYSSGAGLTVNNNDVDITTYSITNTYSSNATYENNFFGTQLYPELTYYFAKNIGIYASLGGIAYSMYDWELDSSLWNVNFNPNYWKLGIRIRV